LSLATPTTAAGGNFDAAWLHDKEAFVDASVLTADIRVAVHLMVFDHHHHHRDSRFSLSASRFKFRTATIISTPCSQHTTIDMKLIQPSFVMQHLVSIT